MTDKKKDWKKFSFEGFFFFELSFNQHTIFRKLERSKKT